MVASLVLWSAGPDWNKSLPDQWTLQDFGTPPFLQIPPQTYPQLLTLEVTPEKRWTTRSLSPLKGLKR